MRIDMLLRKRAIEIVAVDVVVAPPPSSCFTDTVILFNHLRLLSVPETKRAGTPI